jgi:hypothetical protein
MRRLPITIALTVALVLGLPATALAASEGATIDKTGWWNRANTTTPTPAGPVTVPPPPGVPEGTLAVGRVGGEATAISAIGILPDEGPGATVQSLTLTLREDPDADANRGTEDAAIVACPIVDFWAGGENGSWDTLPEFDCASGTAAGVRAEDGTWTFDLTAIGALWFDATSSFGTDGVALLPEEGSEGSFQVVWQGGDAIDVRLEAEPGEPADDPFATPSSGFDAPTSTGGGSASSSGGSAGGSPSIFSPPSIASPPTVAPPSPIDTDAATGGAGDDGAGDEVAGAPLATDTPRASRAGTLVGNLPPAGFLLLPFALATLFATSYWLGPAGQPSTIDRRGGVSRALAARARTAQER